MRGLLQRRVSAKIILSYLVALLGMIAIGFVAIYQLDRINAKVGDLTDRLAVERGLAQEVVSQVWLVRFHANKYVQTQSQADLDKFNTEYARLEDLLVRADDLTTDAQRRAKLEQIKQGVQDYGDAFRQVTTLIKRRQTIQFGTLDVQGLLVENELVALRVGVIALGNPQAFLAFGNAQASFQEMQLGVVNYLATNDEGYVVLFEKGYRDTKEAFTDLQSIMSTPAHQQSAADALAATDAYYEGFQTIRTDNLELKGLFSSRLEVLEPQISATASEIAADVSREFQAQNQSSQDLVSDTRIVVGATTVAIILVVLWLGIWFSNRITAPLRKVMGTSKQISEVDLHALTTQLAALAQGDLRLNLEVTAQPLEIPSDDEVGQVATAFNAIIAELHSAEDAFQDMAAYLNRMASTAAAVAQGNLGVDVPVESQDDVLGNAIANMVADLRSAQRRLQEHQERLEDLVRERTRDVEREKRYFEALILNSPIAIIVNDLTGKIVGWNPAAQDLFGYSEDEAIGRDLDEIVSPETLRNEAVAYSRQLFEGQTRVHAVTQRQRKDGSLVDVEMLGVPVMVENQQVGGLGIYHDISELQRARREAEEANHAKSSFLAVMSHEIRTPMNGVIGMTSLLLDTALTPDQREYAETIRHSGEALLTIINDILDFSKIEAGKMDLENQPFDMRECVESALDLVATRAREKRLELVYLIDSQVPTMLNGDVTRLRQILLNLLSNAVKFTEKGEVVISVKSDGGGDTGPLMLQFSVRDTGIGIPADRANRLFQSFSQIDASTTRQYGGTGLGLAISRRLAELMGGTMWVESVEGEGSTFYFTIQAQPAPAQMRVYLKSEQPQLRDRHVLIVDDNATNRRVLVAQTRSWNMLPRDTAQPHEALEWIKRGDPFDLVLLDMQMPQMDGATLAAELRHFRDARDLPIVMLSSLDRWDMTVNPLDVEAYLLKPVKQSVLYETLVSVFVDKPIRGTARELADESEFDTRLAERIPLRILVAEDNAINQKLALQMLRRMGYRADIAGNGVEVLEALERQPYDVILMDVQMPVMDGFEATRKILEKRSPHRPRIVAVTANAMQGDRELCLAVGMDDYISKPIQVRQLQMALERWGYREPTEPDAEDDDGALVSTSGAIDWSVLDGLKALQEEGEPDFVQETIDLFLADAPTLLVAISEAIDQAESEQLRMAAHTLKGNSRSLGAMKLGAISLELEQAGRSGKFDGTRLLFDQLSREFDRVRLELQNH